MPKSPPVVSRFLDETIVIPSDEVSYWLLADDDEIEKLAAGRVPRRVQDRAYEMLRWKREAAQLWDSYPEAKKETA